MYWMSRIFRNVAPDSISSSTPIRDTTHDPKHHHREKIVQCTRYVSPIIALKLVIYNASVYAPTTTHARV